MVIKFLIVILGFDMKKKNRLLCVLLTFAMVFLMITPIYAATDATITGSIVPADAMVYANEHYREALEVIENYQDYYRVSASKLEDAKLGTAFVIYELDKLVQDEIYYYPILDSQNNIILLMSVMGTTQGWSISISEEWVDGLKELDNITSDIVFYKSGDNLCAEDENRTFIIAGEIDSNIGAFQYENYQRKRQNISDINERFVKVDTNNIEITEANQYDMYTPGFSTSTSSSKICLLNNPVGQGNYGLCWAASVATICNYLKDTAVTAKNVADTMGIGYDEGAGLGEAQQALKMYGISYNNLLESTADRMSWSNLQTNINNKYPVYVSAKTSGSGHAVTAYGYSVAAGTNYVVLWNSGTNGGTGASVTATFKSSGTTFAYNNSTYTWAYSISKY